MLSVTTDFGQARVGVALSLLRDRDIDDRRFAVSKAQLETEIAEFGLLAEQINILQEAYIAYARWLISAELLVAYEELLNIAVVRGVALERQVEAGDVAEILLVENEQAVLQREGLVVESRRQVRLSAERLALYLRDEDGVVVFPNYAPSLAMPEQDEGFLETPVDELIEQALMNRPDIAVAKTLQTQFRLERRIAENLAKPRLDFRVYSARDFGSGTLRRQGTDTIADISFSIPLAIRTAPDALSKGGELICGGESHPLGGTFFTPTIIGNASTDMKIASEETFGPLAPIFKFKEEEQAIAMANDTEFGLAAYFYTRDIGRVWRVGEALEYGIVGINEGIISTEVAPFGGVKQSGIGREGSHYGIEDFLEIKYMLMGGL